MRGWFKSEKLLLLALVAGIAMGIGLGWFTFPYLFPLFENSGLAAWMQAFGSIVAVGVAIYVPSKMKLTELKEEKLRHQKMVRVNLAMAKKTAAYVNEFIGVAMREGLTNSDHSLQASLEAKMMQEKIDSALDVLHLSLDLHLLGESVAAHVLDVIDNVLEMKVCISALAQDHPDQGYRAVAAQRFPIINQRFIESWERLATLEDW